MLFVSENRSCLKLLLSGCSRLAESPAHHSVCQRTPRRHRDGGHTTHMRWQLPGDGVHVVGGRPKAGRVCSYSVRSNANKEFPLQGCGWDDRPARRDDRPGSSLPSRGGYTIQRVLLSHCGVVIPGRPGWHPVAPANGPGWCWPPVHWAVAPGPGGTTTQCVLSSPAEASSRVMTSAQTHGLVSPHPRQ